MAMLMVLAMREHDRTQHGRPARQFELHPDVFGALRAEHHARFSFGNPAKAGDWCKFMGVPIVVGERYVEPRLISYGNTVIDL